MNSFLRATTVLAFITTFSTWCASARAEVAHSVTGSGFVDLNDDLGLDISFRVTVAAHSNEDGVAWGVVVGHVSLAEFGLGETHVVSSVDCLQVDGSSAWIGGTVLRSSQPDVIVPGDPVITMVFDLGGPGQDVLHQESPHPADCHEQPGLFPSVVDHGNFTVR